MKKFLLLALRRKMRKVQCCSKGFYTGSGPRTPADFYEGLFHGFFSEGSNDEGIETYALVELHDGTMRTVQTHCIKFLEEPEM